MDKELEEAIKICKNISKYLQLKIDNGEHKIIYNDSMYDEKTIDCINAIKTLVQAAENSIPTSVIEEKIKELDKLIVETQKELGSASKEYTIYVYQKSILKELLQEKGGKIEEKYMTKLLNFSSDIMCNAKELVITKEQEEAIKYLEQIKQNFLNSAKKRRKNGEDTGYGTLEDVDKLSALEIGIVLNLIQQLQEESKQKEQIISNAINEVEQIRQYFSEDLQVEFIRILEILKGKKVIDW